MKIYKVDLEYIKYLYSIDNKVQFHEGKNDRYNRNRPYIGIVLHAGGHDYFAPFEHPRKSHLKLGEQLIIKMDKGKLGIIGINNMIPIIPDLLTLTEINEKTPLLKAQYSHIQDRKTEIQNKAFYVYNLRLKGNSKYIKNVCCNFKKLESACLEYCKVNGIEHPALTGKKKHEHFEHIDILQENGIITKTQSSYVKENYELLGYEYTKEDVKQCISYVKSGGDKEVALNILEDCGIAHDTFESGLLSTQENSSLNEVEARPDPKPAYEPEQ